MFKPDYHQVARGRLNETPQRTGFAILICAAALLVGCGAWAWIWLGAFALSQGLSLWVGDAARRSATFQPTHGWELRYLAVTGWATTTFASITPLLWFAGGMEGKLIALLVLFGGMLNVALQAEGSRKFLWVGCAPFLATVTALPALSILLHRDTNAWGMLFLIAGSLLYFVHVLTTVLRREKTVIEVKAALSEAEAQGQRAESANAAKTQFLATMSHEIRTPLNGVLGMAQAIDQEPLSETQTGHLKVIRESGQVLLTLLNDLLDISKIEAAKLDLHMGPVDLAALANEASRTFKMLAEGKGVAFTLEVAPDVSGYWIADGVRVRQIMYNLLSNAVKFTDRGGVTARLELSAEGVGFSVKDTGPGIPPKQLPDLFARFSQAEAGAISASHGWGLGLAVSRELARLMGGDIMAQSTLGVGSTFSAWWPLERTSAPADLAVDAPKLLPQGDALQVLVAEDNETNRLVISTLLAQIGVSPRMAYNGEEAVAAWREQEWEVILMDIQMPVLDGVAATQQIRSHEAASGRRRTPIIALTANAMAHQAREYQAAGFDDLAPKPIQFVDLVESIERALDKAALPATLLEDKAKSA